MNKRGITIIELLISISIVAIVVLLLIHVILSLQEINEDPSYASQDEISRALLIKNIEEDFLALKLQTISMKHEETKAILTLTYQDEMKELIITNSSILYDGEETKLETSKASYDLNIVVKQKEIDSENQLLTIHIPVLIDNQNTTDKDDIILTYLFHNN